MWCEGPKRAAAKTRNTMGAVTDPWSCTVQLIKQLSINHACTVNRTFGCRVATYAGAARAVLDVTHGCRGVFNCSRGTKHGAGMSTEMLCGDRKASSSCICNEHPSPLPDSRLMALMHALSSHKIRSIDDVRNANAPDLLREAAAHGDASGWKALLRRMQNCHRTSWSAFCSDVDALFKYENELERARAGKTSAVFTQTAHAELAARCAHMAPRSSSIAHATSSF